MNGKKPENPPLSEDTLDKPREDPSAEFLRCHYKFGHISPKRLQFLARLGVIPRRLSQCPVPLCGSCAYGKAHKRAKRTKTKASTQPAKPIEAPGDCVSVDVLVSSTPGLIAQMSGGLTKKRYKYACIFVDHYSDLGYVHLLQEQTGEALLEAKESFELYAESMGVATKHYHADNGIFAGKAWKQACSENLSVLDSVRLISGLLPAIKPSV